MTDLSAAFDLWHHKLGLDKARLLGLKQWACSWLFFYISGRSQSTIVDGIYLLLYVYQHMQYPRAQWELLCSFSWRIQTFQM